MHLYPPQKHGHARRQKQTSRPHACLCLAVVCAFVARNQCDSSPRSIWHGFRHPPPNDCYCCSSVCCLLERRLDASACRRPRILTSVCLDMNTHPIHAAQDGHRSTRTRTDTAACCTCLGGREMPLHLGFRYIGLILTLSRAFSNSLPNYSYLKRLFTHVIRCT